MVKWKHKKLVLMIAGMVFYCSTHAQVGKNYTVGDTARLVDLPEVDEKDSSVIIGDDKTYHQFFGTYSEKELPVFDFAKEYLIGTLHCRWCGPHCHHARGVCHRNRCDYSYQWIAVKKE